MGQVRHALLLKIGHTNDQRTISCCQECVPVYLGPHLLQQQETIKMLQQAIPAELLGKMQQFLSLASELGIQLPTESNIPVSVPADAQADLPPDELLSVPEASRKYPAIYGNKPGALQWAIRHRRTNGLMDAGAVIEVMNTPTQKRAKILVNHRQYVAFMRGIK